MVKELVENAIDAGALHIDVSVTDAGKTCIQVIDDGKGMSETDARLAFERHATSKIKEAADLFALRTMGFRGEVLASIAAVAQVELRKPARKKDSWELPSPYRDQRLKNKKRLPAPKEATSLSKTCFLISRHGASSSSQTKRN